MGLPKEDNSLERRIQRSMMLAIRMSELSYVGSHWNKYFTIGKNSEFANLKLLERFRAPGKERLSRGLDDQGNFSETVDYLVSLIRAFGYEAVSSIAETTVGMPEKFSIGGNEYNFNDLNVSYDALEIKALLNCDPKIIVEVGGGMVL